MYSVEEARALFEAHKAGLIPLHKDVYLTLSFYDPEVRGKCKPRFLLGEEPHEVWRYWMKQQEELLGPLIYRCGTCHLPIGTSGEVLDGDVT